jgi:hypothetical protein
VSWGGTRAAEGGDSLLTPLDAKLRADLLARNNHGNHHHGDQNRRRVTVTDAYSSGGGALKRAPPGGKTGLGKGKGPAVGGGAAVVVLDRLASLASLGQAPPSPRPLPSTSHRQSPSSAPSSSHATTAPVFPSERLCGHGLSGPLTDLHARFVAAALCGAFLLVTPAEEAGPSSSSLEGAGKEEPKAPEALKAPSKERSCPMVAHPDALPRWVRAFS